MKNLGIKITVEKDTGAVSAVNQEFKSLDNTTLKAAQSIETYQSKLLNLAKATLSVIALKEAIDQTVAVGLEYDKTIEALTNSLETMIVMTSKNETSLGRSIDLTEKQNLAHLETLIILQKLETINKDTPHTLDQTQQIFETMYPSMRKTGASIDELITLTKRLSIATSKIDFQQVLAGVDGLATGTVLSNSDLGRFLSAIGLTNERLKETDDVVKLLNDRFKDVKALESYDTLVSNLANSWQQLMGKVSEPIFEMQKDSIKDLTIFIGDLKAENIIDTADNISNLAIAVVASYSALKVYNYVSVIAAANTGVYANQSRLLQASLVGAAIKQRALNMAMKATPFLAMTAGLTALITYLGNASEKADILAEKFDKNSLKMKNYTKSQLEYRLAVIHSELEEKRTELADAKADAAYKGLFESSTEHKADKARRDQLSADFKKLQKDSRSLKDALKELNETSKETLVFDKNEDPNSSSKLGKDLDSHVKTYYKRIDSYKSIMKELDTTIEASNPIALLDMKYDGVLEKLEKIGMLSIEAKDKISKAYDIELEKIKEQQEKLFEKDINEIENEYIENENLYGSIIKGLDSTNNSFIEKLGSKYEQIAMKLQSTGLATNEDWEKLSNAYLKEYESKNDKNAIDLSSSISSAITGAFLELSQGGSGTNAISGGLTSVGQNAISASIGSMVNQMTSQMGATASFGFGIFLSALGAMLEKPNKTLLEQTNYLEEISSSNKTIVLQTRNIEMLNSLFDTQFNSYKGSSYLQEGSNGYFFSSSSNENAIFNYFSSLYKDVAGANNLYKVKTGEETYQVQKAGFFGIGAVDKTVTQDIYKSFLGNEVKALELLSQFGLDAQGKLTLEGLTNLENTFLSFSNLANTLSIQTLDEIQQNQKLLENINIEDEKLNFLSKYSTLYEKLGVNLAEVSYESLSQYINEDILSSLIKEDSSLNIQELTNSVNSLNNKYNQQIQLVKNLNKLTLEESKKEYDHAVNIYRLQEKVQDLALENSTTFVDTFSSLFSTIKDMAVSTQETIDSLMGVGLSTSESSTFYIKRFNEVNAEFKALFDENGVIYANREDEAKNKLSRLNSLSNNIVNAGGIYGDDLTTLKTSLINDLEENLNLFDNTEAAIKVNIVEGISELFNLNESMKNSLLTVAADGSITNEELNSIVGLSEDQKDGILNVLSNTGLLATQDTLQTLSSYAEEQLRLEQERTNSNSADLTSSSFSAYHSLGNNEKLQLAQALGISGTPLDEFVEQFQMFSIKNESDDLGHLKALLGVGDSYYDENGNFRSFDSTMMSQIQALSELNVLPEDIATAYGTIVSEIEAERLSLVSAANESIGNNQSIIDQRTHIATVFNDILDNDIRTNQAYGEYKHSSKALTNSLIWMKLHDQINSGQVQVSLDEIVQGFEKALSYQKERYPHLDNSISSATTIEFAETLNNAIESGLGESVLKGSVERVWYKQGVSSGLHNYIEDVSFNNSLENAAILMQEELLKNLDTSLELPEITGGSVTVDTSPLEQKIEELTDITIQQANEIREVRILLEEQNELEGVA